MHAHAWSKLIIIYSTPYASTWMQRTLVKTGNCHVRHQKRETGLWIMDYLRHQRTERPASMHRLTKKQVIVLRESNFCMKFFKGVTTIHNLVFRVGLSVSGQPEKQLSIHSCSRCFPPPYNPFLKIFFHMGFPRHSISLMLLCDIAQK